MTKLKPIKRQPTQYDLARELGVSQTTISQVLRNRVTSSIPIETRQRILDAARERGYVPNRIARSLRTGKTSIIAAVIPDISNPFYPTLVRGIQDVVEAHSYHVATYNTDGSAIKEQQVLEVIQQAQVDGLIFAAFHRDIPALLPLLERDIPIVLLDSVEQAEDIKDLPLDTVITDPFALTETAIAYLVSRGHRRIAMLSSKLAQTGLLRVQGYQQALANHQISSEEDLIIWCNDFTEQSGFIGMHSLAQIRPLPTALFAASDQLALGALLGAKKLGIAVPDQMALLGVDNISAGRLVSPTLTTIAQAQEQTGRQAAQLLFDRLTQVYHGVGRHITVPYELIVRESA